LIERTKMHQAAIELEQSGTAATAQFIGIANDQIEHRLGVARRGRHCLQYIDRGGLLRYPLAELGAAPGQLIGAPL
jgi:hypothetical protein